MSLTLCRVKKKINNYSRHFNRLRASLESLTTFANKIFDNKKHKKTFLLAINEYLLNFLQLCMAGKRSPNSLEKMIGRKKRYQSFIFYRYKKHDLFLEELQYEAVAIKDGKIIWTGYYGFQDLEKKIPVTESTIFEAASTSKTITAAAIMHCIVRKN